MRIIKFIFLFLIITNFESCSTYSTRRGLEKQIKFFVKNHIIKNSPDSRSIFIFITEQNGGCLPCQEGIMPLVDSILKSKDLINTPKYLVFIQENSNLINQLTSSDFNIILESKHELLKHGIDIPFNFIIEFNRNLHSKYWGIMVPGNLNKIYRHYFMVK